MNKIRINEHDWAIIDNDGKKKIIKIVDNRNPDKYIGWDYRRKSETKKYTYFSYNTGFAKYGRELGRTVKESIQMLIYN